MEIATGRSEPRPISAAVRIGLILSLIICVVLTLPRFLGDTLSNLTLAALLSQQSCTPNRTPCQEVVPTYYPLGWKADQSTLSVFSQTLSLLDDVITIDSPLGVRRSQIVFALDKHQDAAALTPTLLTACSPDEMLQNDASISQSLGARYGTAIVAAYQKLAAKDWAGSVACFRMASVLGANFMTADDRTALFTALAENHAAAVDKAELPARSAYLAGKYFVRAGRNAEANSWLTRAEQLAGWDQLSADERSEARLYLGLTAESAANFDMAAVAYRAAISESQERREPRIMLLLLENRIAPQSDTNKEVADWLVEHGPGYSMDDSTTPGSNRVVGYDVAAERIDSTPFVDAWLWWQKPSDASSLCAGCLVVGDYMVQQRSLINLMPNAGFEWFGSAHGAPAGLTNNTAGYPGELDTLMDNTPLGQSQVLRLSKLSVAMRLTGLPVTIEPGSRYLVSSWVYYGKSRWGFGVSCSDQQLQLGVSKLNQDNINPDSKWEHFAVAQDATMLNQPTTCNLQMVASYSDVKLDQMLIARLPSNP